MNPLEKAARTHEGEFTEYLMETFGKLPDDSFYEDINPYLKVWLHERWLHKKELENDKLRQVAILIGSFFNPEMAQKMMKEDSPDFETTDVDETSKQIRAQILNEEGDSKRKKRKRKKRKVVK